MADKSKGTPPVPIRISTSDIPRDGLPAVKRQRSARYTPSPVSVSPQRHHHRKNPMARRPVKETLNARSEFTTSQDDGKAEHRINQYLIKQEIGRGSFGAVHLAVDQFGNEYAVKEFSKSRLRKRAQSHLLRRIRCPRHPGVGINSPLHRTPSENQEGHDGNSLDLIKQEIAIMKKLHHSNIVSLREVLDDPTQDPLYMVMEMCKKGVVMKVGVDERADPYDDERCRCWFRDLILGIEYLHAQGIVHRDIKPDNCLLTSDDVLKVVDFGVSEMFERDSDMLTAKSAGSPAFLPPELCVPKHGDVSGKATDVWSMGVTLYCLRYGRLPFEKKSIFDLYEAIRNDPVVCEEEADKNFEDLMHRLLDKDPTSRITLQEVREHPWVTKNGTDPLLSEQENTAEIIGPPTEEEIYSAITTNVGRILAVMKAVKNFKRLIRPTGADSPMQSILGQDGDSHFVEPPSEMELDENFLAEETKHSGENENSDTYHEDPLEHDNASSDNQRQTNEKHQGPDSSHENLPISQEQEQEQESTIQGTRGHARDPLSEEYPYLFIGPSSHTGSATDDTNSSNNNNPDSTSGRTDSPETTTTTTTTTITPENPATSLSTHEPPVVSESPPAADFDVYETAYRQKIEQIRTHTLTRRGTSSKVYLNRRVEDKDHVKKLVDEIPESESGSEARARAQARARASDNTSEPAAAATRIGEKRPVPPVTPLVGLVRSQISAQRQQRKMQGSGVGVGVDDDTDQHPDPNPDQ